MTKPFASDELIARLHALVRRSPGYAESAFRTGTMTIDLNARTVAVLARRIAITNKEYMILEMFALRKGHTLTKEAIIAHI